MRFLIAFLMAVGLMASPVVTLPFVASPGGFAVAAQQPSGQVDVDINAGASV